ncbi:hypothetical protein F5148DRAFT_1179931 [Russula earlei]|uniref:Uncharacterized protein n=1 Tax=Russula earlei TaxID=71964 RepID=A0ACC0UFI8_9AGAM|nr:hypothetical protein F5148DRAFT_1179931 [Russula earlei]
MAHLLTRISVFFTRRVLARLLSTFLCSFVLVVKSWSRFGGPTAFLLLTLKELVFSAQETLAQHLEATILNIMGAFFGIGLSTLARYLASLRPDHSASSRTIPAIFLVFISFVAGWAKSRLPRLQLSARISCFLSIWLLTTDPGISSGSVHSATFFIWMTLSAASICLVSNILFLRWFSTHLARTVATAFSKLHDCLSDILNFSIRQRLLNELLAESVQLDFAYSIAAFELRLGRISVKSIKPLIGVVENVRRELSWGSSQTRRSREEKSLHPATMPATNLGQVILQSMKHVEATLLFVFERTSSESGPKPSNKETTTQLLNQLEQAQNVAKKEFAILFQGTNDDAKKHDHVELAMQASDQSLFLVSLMEMANEMHSALLVVDKVIDLHNTSRTRLWFPHISRAWLGIAPPTIIHDDRDRVMADDNDPERFEDEHKLSMAEAREGLSELVRWRESNQSAPISPHDYTFTSKQSLRLRSMIYGPRITRLRFLLAGCVRAVRHSSHLQHAVKNSMGVMLLSLPSFLPTGSTGQRWFVQAHGQWMIISYVWVLETNTGATWRVAGLRIVGTILGAMYAYITWLMCRTNPYGLVVMMTFADVPISWLITRTGVSSIGVVASVTLPPIAFVRYFDSTSDTRIIVLAAWRATMITAGVLAALVMNTLVFPKHCRMLFLRNTSRCVGLLSQLYLALSRYVSCSHLMGIGFF